MTFARRLQTTSRRLFAHATVRYGFALFAVAIAYLARKALEPATGTGAPFVLFFGAILSTSLLAGAGPALVAMLLSAPISAYAFVVRAGYHPVQAAVQALLFTVESSILIYFSVLITRARRTAEQAGERLQVFAALLENSSDFVGIADPDGTPAWVNEAGRRMVGMPHDLDVRRTQIPDYYAPPVRAFATDVILKSMLESGRWSGETYFRHWQTGEAIPVSDEHFLIRDSTGTRLLGMGTITRNISEARQIRDQLRESEERFRLTLDEAPIGMALVDLDGRFVLVNRQLCEIVGYSAETLQSKTFQDITHPDDLETDLALVGKLTRGDIPRYQLEKRYIRSDGSSVPIMLSASVLRASDGSARYYIAQIEDISDRKRAEEALRFSEARFSGIVSISADAIVSVDAAQRITLFNQGAEAIFGYTAAEALGAPLSILIPERLHQRHRQEVARFSAGPTTARRMGERIAQIVGRRKNGEEFPADAAISRLEVDGKTILTVALRDVTELRRVEREQQFLAEAGAVLSSSLDYEQTLAEVGQLVARDLADWCILDIVEPDGRPKRLLVASADPEQAPLCRQWERLPLDRTRPHLVKQVMQERRPILVEQAHEGELDAFAQSAEHLRLLRALEARSWLAVPLVIRDQLFGALVFVSSKPSRRYRSDNLPFVEALAVRAALAVQNGRLYEQAVRATQLRDEVLGVVAHDLRNPLSLILMQSQLLRRSGGESERRDARPGELIERAAKRMNHLIRDLLDVSAIEAGRLGVERARVAPEPLLTDEVESQRPIVAAASVELRADIRHPLPDVWADPHRLVQVLENLIGNATKFTPPGGQIVVGAVARDRDVLFWVADTGRGIAAEHLAHVFDRFWQARRGEKGAGLGLAITRGIVDAHGGRVWAESTLGRGSTFFFTLPQARAAEATKHDGPAAG